MEQHYVLKIEFSQEDYIDILLLLDSLDLDCFEEGESVRNQAGELEIINQESLIILRLADRERLEEVKKQLKQSSIDIKLTDLGKSSNYLDEWKKYALPIEISNDITICPSWIEDRPKGNLIILDPAYAFGSGSHETTILCAREIEKIKDKKSILDVGTGSGVLSLISAQVGFKEIKGIDIDPLAVQAARENAIKNNMLDVQFSDELISDIKSKYQVVVANIISSILFSIKDELIGVVEKGGTLILSGVLTTEVESVVEAFKLKNFKSSSLDQWSVIVAGL